MIISPSITLLTSALFLGHVTADFYIGGYSGELADGTVAHPSDDNLGGTWASTSLSCSDMSIGSGFPGTTNNKGELLYEWCNIGISFQDLCGGHTLAMGGDGNKCGQTCSTATACTTGTVFATLWDITDGPDYTSAVGTCYYDQSWNEDCASDGSLLYTELVHCHIDSVGACAGSTGSSKRMLKSAKFRS